MSKDNALPQSSSGGTAPQVAVAWLDASWEVVSVNSADAVASMLSDPARPVWVDILGEGEGLRRFVAQLVERTDPLQGLDPVRATFGGENPPAWPPKAKAFRNCVFARTYWLGSPSNGGGELVAEEIHLIVARRSAVTVRYPCVAWNLNDVARQRAPERFAGSGAGVDLDKSRRGILELRDRHGGSIDGDLFGLEVAAVMLDEIIDSLFDSLNALRDRADLVEQQVLDRSWLWQSRRKRPSPDLDQQMLGLRRLLRQIRWAFMPSDEIEEFLSGPFLGMRDEAIRFAFRDLSREADRAVATVNDVTEQVEHTVDLAGAMRTDRLNNTMYVLTAVATVLLVPTLIAGIYGMNFRYMPGLGFRFGYWGALGGMALLGGLIWVGIRAYLRRR
jgi:hypothetical protein